MYLLSIEVYESYILRQFLYSIETCRAKLNRMKNFQAIYQSRIEGRSLQRKFISRKNYILLGAVHKLHEVLFRVINEGGRVHDKNITSVRYF